MMCVCECVRVWVCTYGFSPPLEAVLAVSPAQSVRLCELKPVVGGISGRHSAPLKSFSQTRQSGAKARVKRNTGACAAAWVCVTESVRSTGRGQKDWDVHPLALLFLSSEKSFPSLTFKTALKRRVLDSSMAELWVSWQEVGALFSLAFLCKSLQVDATDGL